MKPRSRHAQHPWRLVESAIGLAILVALACAGVVWPLLTTFGINQPGLSFPPVAEYAVVLVTPTEWVLLLALLGLSPTGRRYLQSTASKELAERNVESQPNNLTIAGLVLAALAVTRPDVLKGPPGQMLVASLASFLLAWAILYGPFRKSAMITSDAMHWTGLTMLLAAVADLSAADGVPTGQAVAVAAAAIVAAYSATLALGYWRSAQPYPEDKSGKPESTLQEQSLTAKKQDDRIDVSPASTQ